ncbi:hypothetical protein KIPB_013621, partial [Kipferlia bialata]
ATLSLFSTDIEAILLSQPHLLLSGSQGQREATETLSGLQAPLVKHILIEGDAAGMFVFIYTLIYTVSDNQKRVVRIPLGTACATQPFLVTVQAEGVSTQLASHSCCSLSTVVTEVCIL